MKARRFKRFQIVPAWEYSYHHPNYPSHFRGLRQLEVPGIMASCTEGDLPDDHSFAFVSVDDPGSADLQE